MSTVDLGDLEKGFDEKILDRLEDWKRRVEEELREEVRLLGSRP